MMINIPEKLNKEYEITKSKTASKEEKEEAYKKLAEYVEEEQSKCPFFC